MTRTVGIRCQDSGVRLKFTIQGPSQAIEHLSDFRSRRQGLFAILSDVSKTLHQENPGFDFSQ